MTGPDLDVYEIAFLAGGVQRVVDTALVALVESGGRRRRRCGDRVHRGRGW